MKNLIIYFSYSGNTKIIAEYINSKIGGDIIEIIPKYEYTDNVDVVLMQAKEEIRRKYQPEIINVINNCNEYDNIYVGSPIWWNDIAPAIRTVMNQYNFSYKAIKPFFTHGGDGIGSAVSSIRQICHNSIIKPELSISFKNDRMQSGYEVIDNWLKKEGI